MLLGIGHKARQGKDELGSYLAGNHGFRVLHFADELKKEAMEYGWSPDSKNASASSIFKKMSASKKNSFTFKPDKNDQTSFLQWLGTYRRKTCGEYYWIDRVIQYPSFAHGYSLREHMDRTGEHIAICDMRYVNELMAIKACGGYTIDVRRYVEEYIGIPDSSDYEPSSIGIQVRYIDPARPADHPSEIELDCIPHDFTIRNNSSIEVLHSHMDAILRYIRYGV